MRTTPDPRAEPPGTSPAPTWLRARGPLALLAVAALVLARGALVASLGDVFFYGEELAKAAAGRLILAGVDLPHLLLPFHLYEGGGFVFSHLDAAAFALLGPSLLTLKVVAIGWTALTLLAGTALVRRCFGTAAAAWFAGLFVLAPQSFQKLSLLALGIHLEACLFLLLALLLLVRIVVDSDRALRTWVALGAVCGLGLYFSYQCVLVLAYAAALLAFGRRGELLSRRGLAGLAGFALGVAPLVAMTLRVGGDVLDIHGASLTAGASDRLERLGRFVTSLLAERSLLERVGLAAWTFATLAAIAWIVTRPRRTREASCGLLLVGFLALFLAAYLASDFAVGQVYHYFLLARLSPVWVLSTVLVAAFLGRGPATQAAALVRRGAPALGALLLACGAADLVRGLGQPESGSWRANLSRLRHTPGYAFATYLSMLGQREELAGYDVAREVLALEEPLPAWLRAEVGQALVCARATSLEAAVERARALEPQAWQQVLAGAGYLWARLHGIRTPGRVEALAGLPEGLRDIVAEASGRLGTSLRPLPDPLRADLAEARALEAPTAWIEGLGWRLSSVQGWIDEQGRARPAFLLDPGAAERFLETVADPDARSALRRGWERALEERTLP